MLDRFRSRFGASPAREASCARSSLRRCFCTSAGMHAIWSSSGFVSIRDYDSWERELLEDRDIVRHIESGDFVPINIGLDGCFDIEVRVGSGTVPVQITERERRYTVAMSAPYLFRSDGLLHVGGIEHVHACPEATVGDLELEPGDYDVVVALLAWDREPGMLDADGKPLPTTLPDFLITLSPCAGGHEHRLSVETFETQG